MKVLVIVDHDNNKFNQSTLNTVSAAKFIGKPDLLVIGDNCKNIANEASRIIDINDVYLNQDPSFKNFLSENLSSFLKDFTKNYTHILFTNNSSSKNIAPRLAGLLDTMIIPDVIEILDNKTFKRPIYAGNAIATCKSSNDIDILTIRSTSFEEAQMQDKPKDIISLNKGNETQLSKYLGADLEVSERPELTAADIVVSGGRGLGSSENFKILEKLADKLGAAMGASRAAVDAGFVPNDWQVGQTGKIVAPNLYIAVGISGAIQHLAGMKDSKVIVAINKDEDAPIFQVADYGLVDDLFKIIPEFVEKI